MATATLNNTGQKMPLVNFGAWKIPNNQAADTIYHAIKHGYKLFDGAPESANEKECGEDVARAIKDGSVKREDLFITSKLLKSVHSKDHVKSALKRVLADWKLDYIDLFLIRLPIAQEYIDPSARDSSVRDSSVRDSPGIDNNEGIKEMYYEEAPITETWAALEECVKEGLVKKIGVSNFDDGLIRDLLNTSTIRSAVVQIENHLCLTQRPLVNFAESESIAVTVYSSVGPQPYVELNRSRAKNLGPLLNHDAAGKITKAHNKSSAQTLLRWATQRGIAVIPKSNNEDRLAAHLQSDRFDLAKKGPGEISASDISFRLNDPADWNSPAPIF